MKPESLLNQNPAPADNEPVYPSADYPREAHGWRYIAKTLAPHARMAIRVEFSTADAPGVTRQAGKNLGREIIEALAAPGLADLDSLCQTEPLTIFCHVPRRFISVAIELIKERLAALGVLESAHIAFAEHRMKCWMPVHPLPEAADSTAR